MNAQTWGNSPEQLQSYMAALSRGDFRAGDAGAFDLPGGDLGASSERVALTRALFTG